MKKIHPQSFIAIIFFVLFIISTPLVLLYTAGYRINLRTQRIEKTGVLIVRTVPEDATVTLDGIRKTKETPARFARLLPREYRITLQKNGYYEWAKSLHIESNRTTFIQDVVLFRDQLPERSLDIPVAQLSQSDAGYIAYDVPTLGVSEIWISKPDEEPELVTRIGREEGVSLTFSWNTSGDRLLVRAGHDPSQMLIINASNATVTHGSDLIDDQISSASWMTGPQDTLLLVIENRPYILPMPGTPELFGDHDTQAAWHQNDIFYLATRATSTIEISTFAGNGQVLTEKFIQLQVGDIQFMPSPDQYLTLFSDDELHVYRVSDGEEILNAAAKEAIWNDTGSPELMFWTDFEVSTFNPKKQKQTLVTRLSKPIDQAAWYPGGSHVLFLSDNKLKAIERDERGGLFATELFNLPDTTTFLVDARSKQILASSAPNQNKGVYSYRIETP